MTTQQTKKGALHEKKPAEYSVLCTICLLLCIALTTACGAGTVDTSDSKPSAPCVSGTAAPISDNFEAPVSSVSVPENAPDSVPAEISADGEALCHLPLAPDNGTEFPEADRALALTDGTVALHLDASEFVPGTHDAIGYTIENTTGHSVHVVFAPRLERWTDGAWERVPCSTGFCGIPDPVDGTCSGSLPLEWFPGLTEGVYRLTYTLYDNDMTRLLSDELAFSACFSLTGENS